MLEGRAFASVVALVESSNVPSDTDTSRYGDASGSGSAELDPKQRSGLRLLTLMHWRTTLFVAATLVFVACSNQSTEACERAALEQALAEMRFGELAADHDALHESGTDHDDGELVGARVEMVLATMETHRRCS